VIWSASVRVTVPEHHCPTVVDGFASEAINIGLITDMEREVVHTWSPSFVAIANDLGRLLHDDVRRGQSPASTVLPCLKRLVSKSCQQPAPRTFRPSEVSDPQLDMMDLADGWHWSSLAPTPDRSSVAARDASDSREHLGNAAGTLVELIASVVAGFWRESLVRLGVVERAVVLVGDVDDDVRCVMYQWSEFDVNMLRRDLNLE
jgi:hypothetical protein